MIIAYTIVSLSGDFLNKYYFPVLVPIGVCGNILSFLVSTFEFFASQIGQFETNVALKINIMRRYVILIPANLTDLKMNSSLCLYIYRPRTKLRQGNVFTACVKNSVHWEERHVW